MERTRRLSSPSIFASRQTRYGGITKCLIPLSSEKPLERAGLIHEALLMNRLFNVESTLKCPRIVWAFRRVIICSPLAPYKDDEIQSFLLYVSVKEILAKKEHRLRIFKRLPRHRGYGGHSRCSSLCHRDRRDLHVKIQLHAELFSEERRSPKPIFGAMIA